MATIRQAVTREIKRRKKSTYAFARELKDVHPVTIMKWLYSGKRISVGIAEKALNALDLVVVHKSMVQPVKDRKPSRGSGTRSTEDSSRP